MNVNDMLSKALEGIEGNTLNEKMFNKLSYLGYNTLSDRLAAFGGYQKFVNSLLKETLASLFNGEVGYYVNIELSSLWQDEERTVEAGVGDPVFVIDDLSGNDDHWYAEDADYRGVLEEGPNGKLRLDWDGANTRYRSNIHLEGSTRTFCTSFESADTSTKLIVQGNISGTNTLFLTANWTPSSPSPHRYITPINPPIRIDGVEVDPDLSRGELGPMILRKKSIIVMGPFVYGEQWATSDIRHFNYETATEGYGLVGKFYEQLEIGRDLTLAEKQRVEESFSAHASTPIG